MKKSKGKEELFRRGKSSSKSPEEPALTFEKEALPWLPAIYNSACRLTGNEADAQDLTQAVFLKACGAYDSFQKGSHMKAWLFKILKNTFYNRLEREKRNSPLSRELEDKLCRESHSPGGFTAPEKAVHLTELNKTLQKGLDLLPPEYRTAIVLCDGEGFSYEEIARILSCPLGTVRSRISRARKLLQEQLKEFLP